MPAVAQVYLFRAREYPDKIATKKNYSEFKNKRIMFMEVIGNREVGALRITESLVKL